MERFEAEVEGTRLVLVQGDITRQEVEAVVNAANPDLTPGGGVSGAIHRAGGPAVTEAAARLRRERGPLPTGEAVLTPGGNLPAKYVIHTVGPVWHGGTQGEPELLAKAYRSCLSLAVAHGLRTLAFPNISTGAYGYPVDRAAEVALRTVRDFLRENPGKLAEVRFVLFSASDFQAYRAAWERVKGL
ncbi:MAG: O-acetyl-ADP-ribose deacetylase [Candidatus Bipolaricaulota bacterium]|nr:O-acetyl-ADP-ribose deacetylase [Candidatus Bipolaricaulota bacterium]MDW8152417.1 O-acetyl-ADP-ribose deacetylase [Candidatus Bipolaricaulota bacterium]